MYERARFFREENCTLPMYKTEEFLTKQETLSDQQEEGEETEIDISEFWEPTEREVAEETKQNGGKDKS